MERVRPWDDPIVLVLDELNARGLMPMGANPSWRAHCPRCIQEDPDRRDRVMSVRVTDDRTVLMYCHRCHADGEELAGEMGLKINELFPGKRQQRFEDRLKKAIKTLEDPLLKQLAEAEQDKDRRAGIQRLDEIEEASVEWVLNGLVARSFMSLIAGEPGAGKSILVYGAVSELTRQGIKVLYLSTENHPAIQVRPAIRATGGDITQCYIHTTPPELSSPDLLIEDAKAVGAEVIVIDTLLPFLPGVDADKAGDISTLLTGLRGAVMDSKLSVLAVHHMNKDRRSSSLQMRVAGSYQFSGQFSHIIGVTTDEKSDWRTAQVIKSNLIQTGGTLKYTIGSSGPGRPTLDLPGGFSWML